MLLGGLWHGASWNFVIWGGYHGAGLAVERWRAMREERPDYVDLGAVVVVEARQGRGEVAQHRRADVLAPGVAEEDHGQPLVGVGSEREGVTVGVDQVDVGHGVRGVERPPGERNVGLAAARRQRQEQGRRGDDQPPPPWEPGAS